jgi:hypothetical protein
MVNVGERVAVKTGETTYERAVVLCTLSGDGGKVQVEFARDRSRGWVNAREVLLRKQAEEAGLVDETSCY